MKNAPCICVSVLALVPGIPTKGEERDKNPSRFLWLLSHIPGALLRLCRANRVLGLIEAFFRYFGQFWLGVESLAMKIENENLKNLERYCSL